MNIIFFMIKERIQFLFSVFFNNKRHIRDIHRFTVTISIKNRQIISSILNFFHNSIKE